jgi:hypothetical protein
MAGSIRTGTLEITPDILKLIAEIDEFKPSASRHDREHRVIDPNRGGEIE